MSKDKLTNRIRPQIPEPEYDNDPKELYAFYGLAAYSAQLLEQGITNLLVGLRILNLSSPTHGDVTNYFDHASKKTMGALLNAVRKVTPFDPDIDDELQKALIRRNYLIHTFFVEHDKDLLSESGRRQMIDELIEIIKEFKEVDPKVDELWLSIWKKYGWTEERIEQELMAMKEGL